MDPITGLIALAGISLASVIGLRLKKQNEEGFEALPDQGTQYPESVAESQTRYNSFSSLLNPSNNPLIPVGSSDAVIKEKRKDVGITLGGYEAEFSPSNKETLRLGASNPNVPRADGKASLYAAIQFCREKGKLDMPFSTLNPDGSVKTQGAVSEDGSLKFDEICGVCLTNGFDEEKRQFNKPQGMVLDPTVKEAAYAEKESKNLTYATIGPSLGQCTGAPQQPAFATNAEDLIRFRQRSRCAHNQIIGGPDNCALCYDTETYSSVRPDAEKTAISVVLRGVGTAKVQVRGATVGTVQLSTTTDSEVELSNVKEGDPFGVEVVAASAGAAAELKLYGYLKATTPKGGVFPMALNLLLIIDDETGSTPRRSGKFENFAAVGIFADTFILSGSRTKLRLRGTIPFTFVQASEFSALDCPDGPFLTKPSSASAFATDQPCYARGSRPGNYNDACLQNRILVAGCTNNGDLYKNPRLLNSIKSQTGGPGELSDIDSYLSAIASDDMVDVSATKLCSGNQIQSPCDPFIKNESLRFGDALNGSNPRLKTQARQCISWLYHNKGASETVTPPRVGPTYTGLVTYKNNQKEIKNIYCLPTGALNPDTSTIALADLARVGDTGFQGKRGVEAVRTFLNNQLEIAVDTTRNANTDPTRKTAIQNCFGTGLNDLPIAQQGQPTIVQNPCGIPARYIRVLPSSRYSDNFIEISQIAVINKEGQNVAMNKSTAGSTGPYVQASLGEMDAGKAVDGNLYPKTRNFYHSATAGGNTQFFLDLGQTQDITKIIYITRGDANRTSNYRKDGIKLQLLNESRQVVNEATLNSALTQEISYLQQGAESTCRSSLPTPTPVRFPAGHQPGLYLRFFEVSSSSGVPDRVPGNRGWGNRIGSAGASSTIALTDARLPRPDFVGVVAKGFYTATGPETLYLYTASDDGIYVEFDGRAVINNWTVHGPTGDYSAPIRIAAAGTYPFELRFFEFGGGALCSLLYRVDDEADWKSDLSKRFSYNTQTVQEEETAYQNRIRAQQDAAAAALAALTTTNISIRHPDGRPWRRRADGKIVLNDTTAPVLRIDVSSRSDVVNSNLGFYALMQSGTQQAVRHTSYKFFVQNFISNNGDFAYRILPKDGGFILQNPLYFTGIGSALYWQFPAWGSFVGYNSAADEVVLVPWLNRNSAVAWKFDPQPVSSVTRALNTTRF